MSATLSKPVLLLDGGLGTTLEDEHGAEFSDDTPLWSSHLLISSPETLSKVQSNFAQAGADIILTATYQASSDGFRKTIINGKPVRDDDAKRYMLSSVDIAHAAFRPKKGLVALSLGAYGATMIPSTEYSGNYGSMTESDLLHFHRERLHLFTGGETWASIDIVAFETLPRLDEVRAVREAIKDTPLKPYWISCVFPRPDDDRLPDQSTIQEVVAAMMEGERTPEAIGINCTKIGKVPSLVHQYEQIIEHLGHKFPRLVLYPDGAGNQVYDTKTHRWVEQETMNGTGTKSWDERMFEIVQEIRRRGRWRSVIVGGCCKTSPAMIKSLGSRLETI